MNACDDTAEKHTATPEKKSKLATPGSMSWDCLVIDVVCGAIYIGLMLVGAAFWL
jgi:hypothetical protein